MFINGSKKNYTNFFKPEKEGIYEIKLKFNIAINDCSFMFNNCENIIQLDLSSFDTSQVTDMNNICFPIVIKLQV